MPSNGLLTNTYHDKLQTNTLKAQEIRSENILSRNINTNSIQFSSKDEIKGRTRLFINDRGQLVFEFDDDDLSKFDFKNGNIGDTKTDLNNITNTTRNIVLTLLTNDDRQIKIKGQASVS